MAAGGKRKNAGRKVGALSKSTKDIKALLSAQVDYTTVISKLMELVNGVVVSEKKGFEEIIYSKPPDVAAAKVLLEYRFGKPQQHIDLTSLGKSIAFDVGYGKPDKG